MDKPSEEELLEYPVIENFSPEVSIDVFGLGNNSKKIVAIVDTGFDGFLQVPLAVGIESNLSLWSSGKSRLADGSVVKNLQCIGKIRFAGRELIDIITLSESGNECLLGMQFLQKLGMDFTVSPSRKRASFRGVAPVVTAGNVTVSTPPKEEPKPEGKQRKLNPNGKEKTKKE